MVSSGRSSSIRKRTTAGVNVRLAMLAGCLGWFSKKYFAPYLLPHGPAMTNDWKDRPEVSSIDYANDSLMEKREYIS